MSAQLTITEQLDPTAPIRMEPFPPVLLGTGYFAPYRVSAWPGTAAFMVVGAALVMFVAASGRAAGPGASGRAEAARPGTLASTGVGGGSMVGRLPLVL